MINVLGDLKAGADAQKALEMALYHKADREYFGVSNLVINDLTKEWRKTMSLADRLAAARVLWDSDVHEARIAAAKLLTQARIKEDGEVWSMILSWVPEFDAWAIADHACSAGARRLQANPERLDEIEVWTTSDHMWTKRAALVMTLPWTKSNHPSDAEGAARDRILGWAATYVDDKEWFIQKAVAWWVRELSKHDRPRAQAFLDAHGKSMKAFARKDAGRFLTKS